ncbi:nucleotide sugar dehydrogenase [Clostridium botulinum]|uniref:nucleotide sugar dehydrogenase n=1 Tax=Clostridium botulinum TaxID=1491 RepID=UPI0005F93CAF|nr:nucleotide sugar dehydrogenase [Clostridium botulinum]KEI87993.1 capsular biosynthesis protein [Clostridium botulinum B2 267]MBY6800474.1 nucleotide sugar dehydrogenase [Clostridium botulinum]MBY6997805.1 nucleotide sugar dehydrogenase [Clostridium botulinum]MBY7010062.1 nucleotide sugar dehydrogenase [Clostridium botulinum]MCC5439068.1 nucleotide sugar dehydrogenase [Clostridium botulinum]
MNKIVIIGQGFVGLPLALSFSLKGYKVIGMDIDKNLVEELNSGITYHTEEYKGENIKEILRKQLNIGNYAATNYISDAIKEGNVIILTVGIPILNGEAITDGITKACIEIGENLKKGDLVIVKSTVIPGTTEEIILPILEENSGLKAGEDFYLAYSSERIAEGRAFDEFENIPTVVAGVDNQSLYKAKEILKIVCKADIIEASSIKIVETSKVFENVQRDVNIAMAQEFARFTEKLGIDIFEVIKVANTHKRVNLLTPGPGVGGYCIPNAYYYLKPKARDLGIPLDILKLCRDKNALIPKYVVAKVQELLTELGKDISKSKIAVLGIAMKDYSNDDRLSPAIEIIKLLIQMGAEVQAYDPVVSSSYNFKSDNLEEIIEKADVLIVLTIQKNVDYTQFKYFKSKMNNSPIYIDLKNVANKNEAQNEGFIYWKV